MLTRSVCGDGKPVHDRSDREAPMAVQRHCPQLPVGVPGQAVRMTRVEALQIAPVNG